MKRYYPEGDPADVFNVNGYTMAQILAHVLRQCGDQLTRDNVMHHAASLKMLVLPMLLPGIKLSTSSQDYHPVKQIQLARFDGTRWIWRRAPSCLQYGAKDYVDAGGLMGYGPNYEALWRGPANFVDKILKGSSPSDLPIEQPTQFDLVVSRKAARALNLQLPERLLLQATDIVE